MSRYLLTQLEPGDERRYAFYLRELKRFDLDNNCRRDFFKYMARKEGLPKFQTAGSFLRKYRPMFEAAVPAWRAKGNHSLRRTFAEKRRRSHQEHDEDELDEKEDDDQDEDDEEYEYEEDGGENRAAGREERDSDLDTTSGEDEEEDQDENQPINLNFGSTGSRRRHVTEGVASGAHQQRQPLATINGTRAAQPAQAGTSRRASRGGAQPNASTQPAEPSGSRRTSNQGPAKRPRTSNIDAHEVIEIKDEPDAVPPSPQRPTPRPTPDAGPSRRPGLPTPPQAPAAEECASGCSMCHEKGFVGLSSARLRRMLHDAEPRIAALTADNGNLRTRVADKDKIIALHERILQSNGR